MFFPFPPATLTQSGEERRGGKRGGVGGEEGGRGPSSYSTIWKVASEDDDAGSAWKTSRPGIGMAQAPRAPQVHKRRDLKK